MNLGTVGVDALMDSMAGSELAQFARKIEKLGYGALWFPEAFGRDTGSNPPPAICDSVRIRR